MLREIKKKLLKSKVIYNFNAGRKCRKIKEQYKDIISYYGSKPFKYTFEELLALKGFTDEWSSYFSNRNLKIFYLGTDEHQDKSGFLQALAQFATVEYFTEEDGSYGHAKEYGDDSKKRYSKRLSHLIEISEESYDIFMMQSWGSTIDVETLLELKHKYGFKVIQIGMDDRHAFWVDYKKEKGVAGLLPAIDLALTTSPESVEWYNKENIPSVFFPEASSDYIFYPENIEKIYDVGFVGGKYGIREDIVDALVESGIDVKCYGNGWDTGRLPLDKTNEFYNQCKIVLGVGAIGYCGDFFSLKLRDFDVPMSGGCYVTSNNSDLLDLYDKDEIILYDDVDDCVKKISELLRDNRYVEFSEKGYKRAKRDHTYQNRFVQLFNVLGININD